MVLDSITRGNDFYLLTVDFPAYCAAQEQVDEAYRDQTRWARMSIFSIARSGIFSSDRTILQYAKEVRCALGALSSSSSSSIVFFFLDLEH